MEKLIEIDCFPDLNHKFMYSKFCPEWLFKSNTTLPHFVDIDTQCYLSTYGLAYILTGITLLNWRPVLKTDIDTSRPIIINYGEDSEHVALSYLGVIYESLNKKFKLHATHRELDDTCGYEDIWYQQPLGTFTYEISTDMMITRYNELC